MSIAAGLVGIGALALSADGQAPPAAAPAGPRPEADPDSGGLVAGLADATRAAITAAGIAGFPGTPGDVAVSQAVNRTAQRRGYGYHVLTLEAAERFVLVATAGDRLQVPFLDGEWVRVIPADSRGVAEAGVPLREGGCVQLDSATQAWLVWLPARTAVRSPVEQVHILVTAGGMACIENAALARPTMAPPLSGGATFDGTAGVTIDANPRRVGLSIGNLRGNTSDVHVGGPLVDAAPGTETGVELVNGVRWDVPVEAAGAAYTLVRPPGSPPERALWVELLRLPPAVPA